MGLVSGASRVGSLTNSILRIKEAFCIAVADRKKSLNRDKGVAIADCWMPLLRSCHQHQHI